jgi:hypothetical protein
MENRSSRVERRRVLGAVVLISFGMSAGSAGATEVGYQRQYGVGVMLGDPTGLSGKAWLSRTNAIDVGLGAYAWGPPGDCVRGGPAPAVCSHGWADSTISVHADYLWESKILEGRIAQLDWHIGGGARALFVSGACVGDCWDLGARAPVGLDLTFQQPTFLEVFLEMAPAFYVVPVAFLSFEGALGVRGYF